jgi:hypothetical protein
MMLKISIVLHYIITLMLSNIPVSLINLQHVNVEQLKTHNSTLRFSL